MSEPSQVEARFGVDGTVTVLSFTWHGHKRPVVSHGRQWDADDGRHYLVMTTGEQIVELVHAPQGGRWSIAETHGRPLSA